MLLLLSTRHQVNKPWSCVEDIDKVTQNKVNNHNGLMREKVEGLGFNSIGGSCVMNVACVLYTNTFKELCL